MPDNDYASFIEGYGAKVPPEGNFVSTDGRILGRHKGITHYTIGQRKGLGIAFGEPMFVTEIRPDTNEVVLGRSNEVFSQRLVCRNLNWMAIEEPKEEITVRAKIRYNHQGALCHVKVQPDGSAVCEFPEPVRAVTPGQAVVFYDGEYVIGGGTIE